MISVKSSRYIFLDSRDCEKINGDYCSDVYINLNETISVNHEVDILFELVDLTMPNSIYNINETNNILNLSVNSTDPDTGVTSVTNCYYNVPAGFYTASTLVTTLSAQEDNYLDFAYNNNTQKITMLFPDNATLFEISDTSTIITVDVDILGFNFDNVLEELQLPNSVYELEDVVNLVQTQVLYIRAVDLMTTNITTKEKQRGNIIASIPLNSTFGNVFYYSPYNSRPSKLESKMIKQIRLQILDSNFDLVNLQGGDWNATFYLSFVYNRGRDLSN